MEPLRQRGWTIYLTPSRSRSEGLAYSAAIGANRFGAQGQPQKLVQMTPIRASPFVRHRVGMTPPPTLAQGREATGTATRERLEARAMKVRALARMNDPAAAISVTRAI